MKMISEMLLALLLSCFSSLDAVLAFFSMMMLNLRSLLAIVSLLTSSFLLMLLTSNDDHF